MRFASPAVAGLILVALTSTADAQRDDVYSGVGVAFGIGRGSMDIQCQGCETSAQADISALFRVTYAVRNNLFVGVEGLGFQKAQIIELKTVDATFAYGGASLLFYPTARGYAFLKLGAGFSHSSGTFNAASGIPTELELNSPTIALGIGADLRIGRTFSLTPYIDYYRPMDRDADLGGGATVTLSSAVFNFGLALTYH